MAGIEALDNSIALLSTVIVDAATEAELENYTRRARTAQHALDRILLSVAQQADHLHTQGLSGTATEVLADGTQTTADAKREAARADAINTVPGLAEAFGSGEVTAPHLDIIAKRTRSLKPEQREHLDRGRLLRQAKTMSPDEFDRAAKRVVERAKTDWGLGQAIEDRQKSEVRVWRDRNTGMGRIQAWFDPERYDQIRTTLDTRISALAASAKASGETVSKDERLAADALFELIELGNGASGVSSRAFINLVVDADTVITGPHDNSVRETSYGTDLPPESIQRHLCDAVVQVVYFENNVKTKVGRASRTATAAQWSALRTSYATCAWDGCDAPVDHCQAHHVRFWEQGGRTDLDNLVPLCSHHHHRVHDGHWRLKLKPDRTLEIRRPNGTLWRTAKPDRIPPPETESTSPSTPKPSLLLSSS